MASKFTELSIDAHDLRGLAAFWCEVHIDVNATDRDQDAEVERFVALGARRVDVGQSANDPWVVLADPEDNEFCVLASRRPA